MRRPGKGGDLVPDALGGRPIRRVGQHGGYGLAHRFRRGCYSVEHPPDAELFAARGVQWLIGAHGDHDQRQAARQRADDAARSSVRDGSAAVSRTRDWGMYRSTWMLSGSGPNSPGSIWRPTVATTLMGRSR